MSVGDLGLHPCLVHILCVHFSMFVYIARGENLRPGKFVYVPVTLVPNCSNHKQSADSFQMLRVREFAFVHTAAKCNGRLATGSPPTAVRN